MSDLQSPLYLLRRLVTLERDDLITLIAYGVGIGVMSLSRANVGQYGCF